MTPSTPVRQLLLVLGMLIAGCRSVVVNGIILTADERPIENASVVVRSASATGRSFARRSDEHGCFEISEPVLRRESSYILDVDSPGYKSLRIGIPSSARQPWLITLIPNAGSEKSTARLIPRAERSLGYGVPCEPPVRPGSNLTLH